MTNLTNINRFILGVARVACALPVRLLMIFVKGHMFLPSAVGCMFVQCSIEAEFNWEITPVPLTLIENRVPPCLTTARQKRHAVVLSSVSLFFSQFCGWTLALPSVLLKKSAYTSMMMGWSQVAVFLTCTSGIDCPLTHGKSTTLIMEGFDCVFNLGSSLEQSSVEISVSWPILGLLPGLIRTAGQDLEETPNHPHERQKIPGKP